MEEESTEIIGEAPAMQEVFRAIGRLSHSVVINGQSGTGMELVASPYTVTPCVVKRILGTEHGGYPQGPDRI